MIKGIDHMEFVVRNVDGFIDMFRKLGFEVLAQTSHHGVSSELKLPRGDQPLFEIHKVSGEENIGINHIAFLVDDIEKSYQELKREGIEFESPPHLVKATGRTIANFRDPDGWRLQLVDARRTEPKNEVTS